MSPLRTLLRKELLDALRDRRALFTLLFLPVFLYPGTLLLVGGVMARGKDRLKKEPLVVAVASQDAQALLARGAAPDFTTFARHPRAEAEALLQEKAVWAVVDAEEGTVAALDKGEQAKVTLLYTRRTDRSMEARERVERLLEGLGKKALEVRLLDAKLPAQWAEPVLTEARDVDFEKDVGPLVASRVLPVILVVMLFMGALYPAVDATAGEKERGTLETLLVAPVRPLEVMAAKYLTVAALATVSALANLAAMGVTFSLGLTVADGLTATMRLGAGQVVALLACLVPSALLVSGFSLAVASLARTFREGQSLLTPLVLTGTLPGLVALMPGMELGPWTALVPLLNVALLVKAVPLGAAQPLHVALTALSTLAASAVGLWLSANAFRSEALRFGGPGAWRDLFRIRPESGR